MSQIIQLKNEHYDVVKKYIYNNFWGCIEILKIFDKNGLKSVINDKNSGVFLGFISDNEELEGLFLFTNNKRFLFHYVNDEVKNKVDLLKAIKHFQPEYLSAKKELVPTIWRMFERTVKRYKYKNSTYMILEEFDDFLEAYDEDEKVIEAVKSDAMEHMGFFVELEKEFERNHMTINQMQKRIADREGMKEYLLIKRDNRILAQAFVEDKIGAFSQIGGVYTTKLRRKEGLGTTVVKNLVNEIINSGSIPMLVVLSDNTAAISVYKKIGFIEKSDFTICELEF